MSNIQYKYRAGRINLNKPAAHSDSFNPFSVFTYNFHLLSGYKSFSNRSAGPTSYIQVRMHNKAYKGHGIFLSLSFIPDIFLSYHLLQVGYKAGTQTMHEYKIYSFHTVCAQIYSTQWTSYFNPAYSHQLGASPSGIVSCDCCGEGVKSNVPIMPENVHCRMANNVFFQNNLPMNCI